MTQNSKKKSIANQRERKDTFEEHYEKLIRNRNKIERVDIVFEQLKQKYEDYDAIEAFIEYLRSIEKIFAQAEGGKWSIEKTEDEMIKGEIYLISQSTKIDEEIFNTIYEEFKSASHDVEKIQEIANKLIEKYSNIEDCFECDDCKEFIVFVRESLFVFSKTFQGNVDFDELGEVKTQLIRRQMNSMAIDGKPPLEVLQDIYNDFTNALKE